MKTNSKSALTILSLLFILLLTYCDTTNSITEGEIIVNSNSELYRIINDPAISLSIKNNSMHAIFYICSGDIYIEELKQERVVRYWKVWGFEECLTVHSIESGETRIFEFDKSYPSSPFNLEKAEYNEEVSYRFRLDFYSDEMVQSPLSLHDRYSNLFMILK